MSGIDVKGFGTISGDLDQFEIIEFDDEPGQTHRKLVIDNGHIRGAVFVGPPRTGQHIATAIASNKDLTAILPRLRQGDWDALAEI
jgi:NAD(P)H-nitrite reductase large subunit